MIILMVSKPPLISYYRYMHGKSVSILTIEIITVHNIESYACIKTKGNYPASSVDTDTNFPFISFKKMQIDIRYFAERYTMQRS